MSTMKGRMFGIMAMSALMAGAASDMYGVPRRYVGNTPGIDKIPFDFKKFKWNELKEKPKGCKCERVTFEFTKYSHTIVFPNVKYIIKVDVDIVYGTEKSRLKKTAQYFGEISAFIRNEDIREIRKHKEDIYIEEVIEQQKQP